MASNEQESLKLLYCIVKLTNEKPSFDKVGKLMDLKSGTASVRFYRLMKALEKQYPEIVNDGVAAIGEAATPKRKRVANGKVDDDNEKKHSKKGKTEGEHNTHDSKDLKHEEKAENE